MYVVVNGGGSGGGGGDICNSGSVGGDSEGFIGVQSLC